MVNNSVSRLVKVTAIMALVLVVAYGASIVHAEQKPWLKFANPVTIILTPGTPIWNPYAPSNMIGNVQTYLPLAAFNPLTGQFYPVLAENWTVQVLPNGSALFTIYLRPGLYWYNGSATLPFTAWDVYAQFYIGMKAFAWYVPWINQSLVDEDIRVINNYTIQFLFQKWTPYIQYWLLTSWIDVPYEPWKPIVDELRTITNVTQATEFGHNNVTKFVAPYWGLYPYYVSYASTTYIDFTLEPPALLATWYKVFPFADWEDYQPTAVLWEIGGNAQAMSAMIAGQVDYDWIGLSEAQIKIINSTSGWSSFALPTFSTMGIAVNPWVYPFDIPQVREALCDVINRTAVAAAWGLAISKPDYYPEPIVPESIATFPSDVRQFIIPCSYDPAKATQILQSIGFYQKNGVWYTPNGTQLTLYVYGPSGFTDWMTMASDAVEQLDAFGINAKLIGQDVGVFWSTTLPNGQYGGATTWLGQDPGYSSMWGLLGWPWWEVGNVMQAYYKGHDVWPFQWPNGTCSPVILPTEPPVFTNGTIVWCVNSTFGYINLTNWQMFENIAAPGTPNYDLMMKIIFAWYHYFVPIIPLYSKLEPYEYMTMAMDPNWLFQGYILDHYPWL
ncbi:ABC transporter substrate-binding protein, partial [Caldivirga sp.]|uniref:ABC transporter substrate-binding protein n=1 Tax=Caldivirga sp. TaxID=2080243 RepID=UPI0025C35464